ncbi:uncharacterized protein LOC129744236 [Uranotaenia lowii]|uniref:uncharacterized protein LOC129744236 n=1 Tax=Uranotaenia lowii TaxID=190385 RepID=UPI002478FD63|nr:uncharacterized protein LOC129744236 [Uranotaenia lowii]
MYRLRLGAAALVVVLLMGGSSAAMGSPCFGNTGISFHPNPEDCTRYILCIDETHHDRQCGPRLIFDVINNACHREDEAICIRDVPTPPTRKPAVRKYPRD